MFNDLTTIIFPAILALAAGLGGATMPSIDPEQRRAAKGCFYVAGALLWAVGVSVGLHAEGLLLPRIALAACIGALAAGGTVYAVSLIRPPNDLNVSEKTSHEQSTMGRVEGNSGIVTQQQKGDNILKN